jgi:L-alanine-DL-glutamate epimerase-like enolase superfamily enzyme
MKGPTRSSALVMVRVYTKQDVNGVGECYAVRSLDGSSTRRLHKLIAAVGGAMQDSDPQDINVFLLRFQKNPPKNDTPSPFEWRWENDLLEPPTVLKNGEILLSDNPGLGSKLNEKLLASRRLQ